LNGKFADNATLQEVVDQHNQDINYLKGLIEELQGQVGNCECDKDLMAQLKQFMNDMNSANVDADDLKNMKELLDQITNNYTTINEFITNIGISKQQLNAALDSLKKAMVNEYDLDSVKVMEERIISALNLAQDAGKRLDKIEPIVNEVKKIAGDADSLSKDNKDRIAEINKKIADMGDRLQLMSDSLLHAYKTADSLCVITAANELAIEKLDSTVKDHKESLDKLKEQVPELYNKVDSLSTEINNLKPEITKLYNYADANLEKAKAYTDLEIALLRANLNGLDVDLEALRKELGDKIFNLREDLNDAVANLSERIAENTLKIGEVDKKLDSIANDFKDSLAALRADLSDLAERVKKNEEDIAELFGELDILKENLKRQVTGIIIQGSYNPAFGSLRVPAGIQTNALIAYYGNAYRDVYFPTSRTANYVDETKALTAEDMAMIGGEGALLYKEGDVVMQSEDQNAGTLYLTINPNTVDFSKLQLSIQNTKGEDSYIKLGELKQSETSLQFGYTRAADNGFYEAPAYLAAEDIDKVQKINFNTASMKDAIKEIMNKGTSADPKKIALDIVDIVKGLKADADWVACEWEDSVKEGETPVKHKVTSDANLLATAIKPFSLQTLKGVEPIKAVPGYNRVMSFINKVSDKIKGEVKVAFDNVQGQPVVKKIQNLTINKVNIADLNDATLNQFNINKTIVIDNLEYQLDINKEVVLPIKFSQEVDFGTVQATVPSLTISGSNTAAIVVPVKDGGGTEVGTASIPVGDVQINATSDPKTVDVVIGKKTITVNKDVTTTIKLSQLIELDDKTITVNVDMRDAVKSLWGNVQTEVGGVNTTLDQVEDIVKDVNTLLGELNTYREKIDTKIDGYTDQVSSYVTRINNKLVSFVNNFNDRLQPVLVASDGKGAKMLSEAPEYPTIMGSDINFVPTTWTLELAVPLAKKHVAVTNVINGSKSAKGGDATCKAELNRVNSSPTLNTILSGDKRRAYATELKSGYIYEVAYSALDFHGKIAARKYYIKIK
jgi:uncharacterized coiled-coil DUF342 family protein